MNDQPIVAGDRTAHCLEDLELAPPANTAEGDLLLAFVAHEPGAQVIAPDGWQPTS